MALLALAGCGAAPGPASAPAAPAAPAMPPNEQLCRLVERYWDEHLGTDNAISPQFLADSLGIERRYLADVLNVPRDGLDASSRPDLRHFQEATRTRHRGLGLSG